MHAAVRELGTLFTEGAVGTLSDGQLLDRFLERRDAWAFEAIVERQEGRACDPVPLRLTIS